MTRPVIWTKPLVAVGSYLGADMRAWKACGSVDRFTILVSTDTEGYQQVWRADYTGRLSHADGPFCPIPDIWIRNVPEPLETLDVEPFYAIVYQDGTVNVFDNEKRAVESWQGYHGRTFLEIQIRLDQNNVASTVVNPRNITEDCL